MSMIGSVDAGANVFEIEPEQTREKRSPYRTPHEFKTGKDYPHSSTRQRARYARQVAAGQLKF